MKVRSPEGRITSAASGLTFGVATLLLDRADADTVQNSFDISRSWKSCFPLRAEYALGDSFDDFS